MNQHEVDMRVIVAGDDPRQRSELRQELRRRGLTCAASDCTEGAFLSTRVARSAADTALVVVGDDTEAAVHAVRACAALVPVFVVCDDTDQLPRFLRAGARGYLRPSAVGADIADVVAHLRAA